MIDVSAEICHDFTMAFQPFDKDAPFDQTRRNLPHRTQEGCTYFLTWRLGDCLPLDVLARWKRERAEFIVAHPSPWDLMTQRDYDIKFVRRMERWVDKGHGSCVLKQPAIREIMVNSLRFFNGARYELDAFVVMPNHVHVLVTPNEPHHLRDVLHSWKSFTSTMINRALGTRGQLWMEESFNHAVRSAAQLARFRRYIRNNPSAAFLEDGTYSHWQRSDDGEAE